MKKEKTLTFNKETLKCLLSIEEDDILLDWQHEGWLQIGFATDYSKELISEFKKVVDFYFGDKENENEDFEFCADWYLEDGVWKLGYSLYYGELTFDMNDLISCLDFNNFCMQIIQKELDEISSIELEETNNTKEDISSKLIYTIVLNNDTQLELREKNNGDLICNLVETSTNEIWKSNSVDLNAFISFLSGEVYK